MSALANISDFSLTCSLGSDKPTVLQRLLSGDTQGLRPSGSLISGRSTLIGHVLLDPPPIPDQLKSFDCLNNRLLFGAYSDIRESVEAAIDRYGPERIGVVLGSSTGGIAEGERALAHRQKTGGFPPDYSYLKQELGAVSEFLSLVAGAKGPMYTVSTACSSAGRAFISATRLLQSGICDAVITGGADTLCDLTVNGFDSLEAISAQRCNPFSRNRDGINIGEGAALFLLTRERSPLQLLGMGESSDAYHISSPEPSGAGPERAIIGALETAGMSPSDIGYLNLHGTGTEKNDLMESKVVSRIFGENVLCSSTKQLIGHTLGAAGALELAFCCLILGGSNQNGLIIPHIWDGECDPQLNSIQLAGPGQKLARWICMSNSFAFGGNNVSLIIGCDS